MLTKDFKKTAVTSNRNVFTAWEKISDSVAEAYRLTDDEKRRLKSKRLAKLIASIPYLAGCEDAERTAIANLSTYLLSTKLKNAAKAKVTDDDYLMKRIHLLNNFIGGDPSVIRKGMDYIALVMINDYYHDREEDRQLGKYNPVNAGALDYDSERGRLLNEIRSIDCPEMDKIADPEGDGGEAYWEV